MTPTNRQDAMLQGATLFNTGRPCQRGHASDRYTSTGNCVACLRDRRKEFAALVHEARKPSADTTGRLFAYRLHPDDHAAALAFCQALDIDRGRMPQVMQALQAPEPPRMATAAEVAAHRERIMQDLGAAPANAPAVKPYRPAEFTSRYTPTDER